MNDAPEERPGAEPAGYKLCKPWKMNGHRTERPDGERFSDHRWRTAFGSRKDWTHHA